MDFPCTSCGLCCKYVGIQLDKGSTNPLVQLLIDRFPYETNSIGTCEMFVDGQCSVYHDRPLLCNVKMGGVYLGVQQKDWYKVQALGCNDLIDQYGLDSSFKLPLDF